ncbi:hypothetical protein [Gemmatimonas aurantiaca]|uniref:hypothetical protein n=1 Tax=Gemmatimonas aurantiaca TaxID=173480 RepID=UPI00301C5860
MLPPAFDLRARIAIAISDVLAAHGIHENITWEDIAVTPKVVTDGVGSMQKISSAIIGKLWPSVRQAQVYHYTSEKAAEEILSSQRFRLANIGKRITEGEIETFCVSHGLTGYLEATNGAPLYRTLIEPNTYFACFTDINVDEDEERSFWQSFGPVRLRFTISAQNPDFRRVYYEPVPQEPIPVLRDLVARVRNDFEREFILRRLSSICSFYLSGARFAWEKETRILWRVWDGSPCRPVGTGPNSYVELELGSMSPCGFELSIVEVCSADPVAVPDGVKFVRRK